MKAKNLIILSSACLALFMSSCSNFLDVTPQDKMTEKTLFESQKGFNTALNGIYTEMNVNNLYGSALTMGVLDVMAQYYNVVITDHNYSFYNDYDFTSQTYKNFSEGVWQKTYSMIANVNAILDNLNKKAYVLEDRSFKLLKGESLALRAFFHFDLFRLYGSNWSEDTNSLAIPYVTTANRAVTPIAKNGEVANLLIKDLEEALSLLAEVDPIRTEGVLNTPGNIDNAYNYRQYRFNYFAVLGMLARVYHWKGDELKANEYAKRVISEGQVSGSEIFPFVTEAAVKNRPEYPDRVFSTEVIFSLYNSARQNAFNSLFNYTLGPTQLLTFQGNIANGRVTQLYSNESDYRKLLHWGQRVNSSNTEVLYFMKYMDVTDNAGVSSAYRYMVPLLRISEMYLIAMETTTDLQEAESYYNKLQIHRGLPEVSIQSHQELNSLIQNEYLKEFIGEGQMYFYFKRNRTENIPSGSRPGVDYIKMDKVHYIMPLPDSEISQRN